MKWRKIYVANNNYDHSLTINSPTDAHYKEEVDEPNNSESDLKPIFIGLENIQHEKCDVNSKEWAEADVAAAYRSKNFTRN